MSSFVNIYIITSRVSWSVVTTDVERKYQDEDKVGEMKRGDAAKR